MAAYIALFIALVSLILMIVILIRFKKLFSTDAIIEKTKSQINRVIMDVNNNANRDIELINESSRRLRALLNEADKKMENFKEATQLLRNLIAETEKNGKYSEVKPAANKTQKKNFIDPDASFEVRKNSNVQQGSLFDDETIVTQDGAAFKEVPLFNAKVLDEKPPVAENKSYPPKNKPFIAPPPPNATRTLKDKVEKLFNQGMQVDDIAEQLSCPSSEVQFIIDML